MISGKVLWPCSDCQKKNKHFFAYPDGFWMSRHPKRKNGGMEVVWNVIPIVFLQMRLGLDAVAAQIGFQIVFCISRNATENDNIRICDRNGRSIHSVFKQSRRLWLQHGIYIKVSSIAEFFLCDRGVLQLMLIWRSRWCTSICPASVWKSSSKMWVCLRHNQSNPCR